MTSSQWEKLIFVGASALALSVLIVPLARRVALRFGIVDVPSDRKRHKEPTPYLGGVAVVVAVIGAVAIGGWRGQAWALLACAVLVACVGLIDDIRTAKPLVRLMIEVAAAGIAFVAGARIRFFGTAPDAFLTIVWLVGLTNAYNLLDNMDACASAILAASATALLVSAALGGQVLVATMAVAIVAAAVGFLVYNWHPARVFLGDAGSLFLGFLVSAIALKIRFPVGHLPRVGAVVLIAGPALFDTTLVVISRLRAHRPVYIGGTDHTSHRLTQLGFENRQVALLLMAVSAVCGTLGVVVGRGMINPWLVVGASLGIGALLLIVFLRIRIYDTEVRRTTPGVGFSTVEVVAPTADAT